MTYSNGDLVPSARHKSTSSVDHLHLEQLTRQDHQGFVRASRPPSKSHRLPLRRVVVHNEADLGFPSPLEPPLQCPATPVVCAGLSSFDRSNPSASFRAQQRTSHDSRNMGFWAKVRTVAWVSSRALSCLTGSMLADMPRLQGAPPATRAEAKLLVKIDWSVCSTHTAPRLAQTADADNTRRFILSFICLMYFSNVRERIPS